MEVTGLLPVRFVEESVAPGTGALALTTYDSTLHSGFRLTGLEPTIDVTTSDNVVEEPGTGALTLAGEIPDPLTNHIIGVPIGSISITGETPVTLVSITIAPDVGAVALTGILPTLDQTAHHIRAPPVGSIALTGSISNVISGNLAEHSRAQVV